MMVGVSGVYPGGPSLRTRKLLSAEANLLRARVFDCGAQATVLRWVYSVAVVSLALKVD